MEFQSQYVSNLLNALNPNFLRANTKTNIIIHMMHTKKIMKTIIAIRLQSLSHVQASLLYTS